MRSRPDGPVSEVAGPVLQGRSETTHLPWIVDAGEISRRFAISSVALLNDLEATAYGALALTEDERSLPKAFNSGSGSAERNKLPSGWGSCPNHFRNAVLGARSLAHLLKAAEEAVRAGV